MGLQVWLWSYTIQNLVWEWDNNAKVVWEWDCITEVVWERTANLNVCEECLLQVAIREGLDVLGAALASSFHSNVLVLAEVDPSVRSSKQLPRQKGKKRLLTTPPERMYPMTISRSLDKSVSGPQQVLATHLSVLSFRASGLLQSSADIGGPLSTGVDLRLPQSPPPSPLLPPPHPSPLH